MILFTEHVQNKKREIYLIDAVAGVVEMEDSTAKTLAILRFSFM